MLFDEWWAVLKRIRGARGARRRQAARASRGRFNRSLKVMDSNVSNAELSLAWLARRVGISERQLQRDFLMAGTSFVRILREKRLERAARTIANARQENRQVRVIDIALDSGFRDLSNFNRAFRARFNCCPGQYAPKP